MTVSPNRPQDGNPQPKVGGTGVEPSNRSRVASLPPTLFKLPNLGGKPVSGRDHAPGHYVESSRDGLGIEPGANRDAAPPTDAGFLKSQSDPASAIPSQSGRKTPGIPEFNNRGTSLGAVAGQQGSLDSTHSDRNAGARQNAVVPMAPPAAAEPEIQDDEFPVLSPSDLTPVDSDADESLTSSSQAPPPVTGSAPRPSLNDAPAGRSWMESLGSHGVVIVLLLVVVAAALLTGQGDEDQTATSLSTQSELLNFDELNVDLPLPTHGGQVSLAESFPTAANESNPLPVSESPIGSAPNVATTVTPEVTVPTQPPASASVEPPMTSPATSVANLDVPQVDASAGLDHELNQGFLPNNVQTNRFVASDNPVHAMTAANRVDSQEADSSLPSLEELAGLQEQSVTAAEPKSVSPPRTLTKTPVGISDWSKYLPTLNSAAEPDAGTSSPSNQVFQP